MEALIAVAALLAGIGLGFWLKGAAQKGERGQIDERQRQLSAELSEARARQEKTQAEVAESAGFKSLAEERGRSIEQLTAEKEQATRQAAEERRALEARLGEELQALRGQLQTRQEEMTRQSGEYAGLQAQLKSEQEKVAEVRAYQEQLQQKMAQQFEVLAGEILEKKSKSFSEGSQKELGSLLTPLREQLEGFRKKVEEAQSGSENGVTKLETLIGALSGLNQQLAQEAQNLSTALRGSSKAQGDWGEFILRDLLEKAGLREGEEYTFQQTFPSMEVNGERIKSPRTDVIVKMPGGRSLVIDSKVSLNAYTESVNAATAEGRQIALAEHVRSMRKHISGLSKAGYHQLPGVDSPDFVVMFVPVEPAFLGAIQATPELWNEAYKQGVLLVGPTTLLFVIRIVHELWQQHKSAQNVQEVLKRGAALYDKFVGFVGDLQAVGQSMQKAEQSYLGAMRKLSEGPGNLVRQVQLLKNLKVRSANQLPQALLDASGAEEELLDLAAEGEEPPLS